MRALRCLLLGSVTALLGACLFPGFKVCKDAECEAATLTCAERGGAACAPDQLCLTSTEGDCCPPGDCFAIDNRRYATARYTPQPIVMDGVITEWTAELRGDVDQLATGKNPSSTADFSSTFAARWDTSALYVLLEARDDILVPNNSAPYYYEDDAVEIFIDMDPRAPKVDHDETEDQLWLTQTNEVFEYDLYARGWPASTAFSSTSGRWWFEFKLPWPNGLRRPQAGDVLGFDVALDDDDNEGGDTDRETQLVWNDATGNLCCDARNYGLLRLVDDTP